MEIGASSSLVRLSLEKRDDDSSLEQGDDSTEKKKGSRMERYSVWGEMAPPSEAAMDSFLRGDYHKSFSSDAGPHPGLGPGDTVQAALTALRDREEGSDHGAAVFLRFCAPLKRGERWGGGTVPNPWKEVLRGAITPTLFARRLRASQFSGLLDWTKLDVTEGYSVSQTTRLLDNTPTVSYVNAALFFGNGIQPTMIQFRLRKRGGKGGLWLIDTATLSKTEWFVDDQNSSNNS